jgi:hypothetical protein
MLRKEYETEQAIIAQRLACAQQKDAILPHVTVDTFSSLVTEEHMQRSVEDGELLRLRQQGNSELLTGVSINHLSSSLSLDAGSLSSLLVPSTSQVLAQQRQTESVQLEQSADNVFLTNILEQGDSQQLFAKAANESTLLPNVQSFGSYVDTSGFNFFRIEESSKLRQRIEEKITEARKVVEYKPGDLFPSIRPDKLGLREPDHDSIQWQTRHIIKVQTKVRGFLARRRVLKLRVAAKFHSSAHKVRTLVIGFMWRYRQRQKYWEARFEAFMMRKTAVKKFRASMTLAALFRKIVRARRQMREDDERQRLLREGALTSDKLTPHTRGRLSMTAAQTPISRNVRRRHAQKLIVENEAETADSPHAATGDASPVKGRGRSRSRSRSRSKSPDRNKHVTISTEVTEFSKPTTPAPSTPAALSIPELTLSQSAFSPPVVKLTPQERQRQLELPGPYEESKRREQLKNDALNLVARVNRGKVQADTLHYSRLVPMQSVPNLPSSHAKMRKFSAKEYAFLNIPSQAPPQSLIKSCSDVFVGPIPKRIPSAPKSRLGTSQSAESMHTDASSVNTSASGGNHSTASTAERGPGHYPGITLPRGGSFSAFPTPHGSGKLTNAGANVISSSAAAFAGSQSSSALRSRSSGFGATDGQGGEHGNLRASQTISASAAAFSGSQSASALRSRSSAFGVGDGHNNGSGSGESVNLRGSQSVTSLRSESQGGPGSTGGRSGSPASALLRYNSTGLSKRTKKQQEAHDKAEAERLQLRNTLIKYM